jgi:hypothetical protein
MSEQPLSEPTQDLLGLIARAIFGRKLGYIPGMNTFKELLRRHSKDSVVQHLAILVEKVSHGTLTVRRERGLLYGYVQGGSIGLVLCLTKDLTPEDQEVSERHLVQQAWFLIESGLLPAGFDGIPEGADPFMRQANGM